MPNHKITFTLRQHTPLIHFQHDQPGATLRATELKPKLDRHLRRHRDLDYPEDQALPYKVHIYYDGRNHYDYPKPYVKSGEKGYKAPYFAGGVSIEHTKHPTVVFHSFDPRILIAIKSEFPRFLSFENFGTRQSKGFGGFHIDSLSQRDFEDLLMTHPYPVYKLNKRQKDGKAALDLIDEFYKGIKSGINYRHKNYYKKSRLFEYMCDRDTGWEKRWLKEKFPQIIHGDHEPVTCSTTPEKYLYIRALLGLAELYEYRPKGGNKRIRIASTEKIREGRTLKPKYQRMRSPLTFKVFDGNIYILQDRIYESILDKSFDFTLDGRTESIKTPNHFDLNDFLQYLSKQREIIPLSRGNQ